MSIFRNFRINIELIFMGCNGVCGPPSWWSTVTFLHRQMCYRFSDCSSIHLCSLYFYWINRSQAQRGVGKKSNEFINYVRKEAVFWWTWSQAPDLTTSSLIFTDAELVLLRTKWESSLIDPGFENGSAVSKLALLSPYFFLDFLKGGMIESSTRSSSLVKT